MQTKQRIQQEVANENVSDWFDSFISQITVDKMMMETGTAPEKTKVFYDNVVAGNTSALAKQARDLSTMHYVPVVVNYYLTKLGEYKALPQKLAFDFSDAKILVWAQISADDENTENALILSEAKANANYKDTGFYVSSTIVEDTDGLPVPAHYHEVNLNV